MLTIDIKLKVYQACVLSMLLYGSETWILYARQERAFNNFHLRCLRRILGITWQDHVPNKNVLAEAGIPSMFVLVTQRSAMLIKWKMFESPKTFHAVNLPSAHDLPGDLLYATKTSVSVT